MNPLQRTSPVGTYMIVNRMKASLPELMGDHWDETRLESMLGAWQQATDRNEQRLYAAQLTQWLAQSEAARERYQDERLIQAAVFDQLKNGLQETITSSGWDIENLDDILITTISGMRWEYDPETMPDADEKEDVRGVFGVFGAKLSRGGVQGGKLVRIRNFNFTPTHMIFVIGNAALTQQDTVGAHWLLRALGVFLVARSIYGDISEPIDVDTASVLWACYRLHERKNGEAFGVDELTKEVTRERQMFGLPNLSDEDLTQTLGRLQEMQCIQQTGSKTKQYTVIEDIQIA